ncbi:MAG: CRISPR-associated endoribonuclease Cas6 [Chitinophagales bacterium]|jgi:CRISPR-associated endoribonuclease Cas6|nr:CRISPR-associated endoribonuclease Cas6 [Chitinophagales bacterium]
MKTTLNNNYLNKLIFMRFKLTLCPEKYNAVIPLNYYYPISAWIYKKIEEADGAYSDFLHNQGYRNANQNFKFFTFASLQVAQFAIEGDRMKIQAPQVSLMMSFYIDRAAENFIMGVFKNQTLELADHKSKARLRVEQVELLPLEISPETLQIRTVSPLVVAKKIIDQGKKKDYYLHPQHEAEEFGQYLIENLINKYLTVRELFPQLPLSPEMTTPQIKILDTQRMKRKGITIKANTPDPIKVIGYEGLVFELTAPIPMLEVGLLGGFGKHNAEGMGCGEIMR